MPERGSTGSGLASRATPGWSLPLARRPSHPRRRGPPPRRRGSPPGGRESSSTAAAGSGWMRRGRPHRRRPSPCVLLQLLGPTVAEEREEGEVACLHRCRGRTQICFHPASPSAGALLIEARELCRRRCLQRLGRSTHLHLAPPCAHAPLPHVCCLGAHCHFRGALDSDRTVGASARCLLRTVPHPESSDVVPSPESSTVTPDRQ